MKSENKRSNKVPSEVKVYSFPTWRAVTLAGSLQLKTCNDPCWLTHCLIGLSKDNQVLMLMVWYTSPTNTLSGASWSWCTLKLFNQVLILLQASVCGALHCTECYSQWFPDHLNLKFNRKWWKKTKMLILNLTLLRLLKSSCEKGNRRLEMLCNSNN